MACHRPVVARVECFASWAPGCDAGRGGRHDERTRYRQWLIRNDDTPNLARRSGGRTTAWTRSCSVSVRSVTSGNHPTRSVRIAGSIEAGRSARSRRRSEAAPRWFVTRPGARNHGQKRVWHGRCLRNRAFSSQPRDAGGRLRARRLSWCERRKHGQDLTGLSRSTWFKESTNGAARTVRTLDIDGDQQ